MQLPGMITEVQHPKPRLLSCNACHVLEDLEGHDPSMMSLFKGVCFQIFATPHPNGSKSARR